MNSKPYQKLDGPPYIIEVDIPYEDHFGMPSYEVCACCGYEFGNDDNPGTVPRGTTFLEHREAWVKNGAKWFDEKLKPENWNLEEQLKNANP